MFLSKYIKALKSMVKTSLGAGKVTPEQYQQRLAVCDKCPALLNRNTSQPTCGACGCWVLIKALDKEETCPIGREEWRV